MRYHGKDADTGEPIEYLIENMETRSQLMNRENAMRILKSKLYQRELDKRMATQQALEATKNASNGVRRSAPTSSTTDG